jgi:hypothetical protein
MSEDIRKMMDKVKNFKQFVNENINNHTLKPYYYIDDFYVMDGMDYYNEEQALEKIQKVIDYVLNIQYPLKVYRGINTINPDEDFASASWTTDVNVAEGFGNKIYIGLIPNQQAIDVEQTIRTRVMNPFEYEIYVPNFDDVKIIDTYEKKRR